MESSQDVSQGLGERPALTLRASGLSEFRHTDGALAMFDVAGHCTTFGMLCSALAQFQGLEFADRRVPARFEGPARFRFKKQDFAIALVHTEYRIVVLNPSPRGGAEDLLAQVRTYVRRRLMMQRRA